MKNKSKFVSQETQNKALELLQNNEDKSQAVVQAMELLANEAYSQLITQLQSENEEYLANKEVAKSLGLRESFSAREKEFYEKLVANQSITFTQEDIIPAEIVDITMNEVRTASRTLSLVNISPVGVQRWYTASKTGAALWGGLTDRLTSELTATFETLSLDVNKCHALMVIPKSIRELALPLVDKYFKAILAEAMHDGLVDGYLNGDGKVAPIGITRRTNSWNEDKSAALKTVHQTVTGFSPKQMSEVLKTLTNDGKRNVDRVYVIANPSDMFEYVHPSLYYFNGNGYVSTSKVEIIPISEPMMKKGTAVFTIENAYTLGVSKLDVKEYDQTKAVEDADLIIAKLYGNGRAKDDNTSYVFNVTKLEEFVPTVNNIAPVATSAAAG